MSGRQRYDGRLEGEIPIELWSITEADQDSRGLAAGLPAGEQRLPRHDHPLRGGGPELAAHRQRGLPGRSRRNGPRTSPGSWPPRKTWPLTAEHWEVIRFLRASFARHGTPAHGARHDRPLPPGLGGRNAAATATCTASFRAVAPRNKGNRLAGLLRTKGEH